jgi:hypothetical protein
MTQKIFDELSISPEVPNELKKFLPETTSIKVSTEVSSKYYLSYQNQNIQLISDKNIIFEVPFKVENINFILNLINQSYKKPSERMEFSNTLKQFNVIQKSALKKTDKFNSDFDWQNNLGEIISITNNSHSLISLIEKLLETTFFKYFSTFKFLFHLKGHGQANMIGIKWRNDKIAQSIPVEKFNHFFNQIKKSKNKVFHTDFKNKEIMEFNGSFLAHDISSQNFNIIAVATRGDFLPFHKREMDVFKNSFTLLESHIIKLLKNEFEINSIAEITSCITSFPAPVKIKNKKNNHFFQNNFPNSYFTDKNIFYQSPLDKDFILEIFESSELQNFSFDLFHFQRVSLLGELLNTLKHELSNPLFGLKLCSDLCSSYYTNEEDKVFMCEIKNNIQRCQNIIENFSSLYFSSDTSESFTLEKVIKELLTISKSELREIRIDTKYSNCNEKTCIQYPLLSILQILFNLIINSCQAIKAISTKGLIEIKIEVLNSEIIFTISDNGSGITKETQSLLFKPFFTTKKTGNGLGLLFSQNLARKLSGDLVFFRPELSLFNSAFKLVLPFK